jgi:hypothetical protein
MPRFRAGPVNMMPVAKSPLKCIPLMQHAPSGESRGLGYLLKWPVRTGASHCSKVLLYSVSLT